MIQILVRLGDQFIHFICPHFNGTDGNGQVQGPRRSARVQKQRDLEPVIAH